MSRVLRNTLAHAAGQLVYPILSLVLVPFYLRQLGLDGYGVVAFLTLLVTLLGVFTRGLGAAFQREVARRDDASGRPTLRRLFLSVERIFAAAGGGLALIILGASAVVPVDVVGTLDPAAFRTCGILVALRVAVALPTTAYQGVYLGLQQHVRMNALTGGLAAASAINGAVVLLWWPSVVAFYASEVVHAIAGAWLLRRGAVGMLPAGAADPAPRRDELRGLARLSLGLMWTNGLGLLISQCDRVAIVRALPIDALGVYNVGSAGGRVLGLCYGPILSAVYPHLCGLVGGGDMDGFARQLSATTRRVTVIAASLGLPMSVFASDLLEAWTRHPELARRGAGVWAIYTLGNLGIAAGAALYQGQMALGRTGFGVAFNSAALVWYPALVLWLVGTMGLPGAAWAWALYGALAWAWHLGVTGRLLGIAWAVRMAADAAIVVAAATTIALLTHRAATAWFPTSLAGRLGIAAAGGLAATAALWWLVARRRSG